MALWLTAPANPTDTEANSVGAGAISVDAEAIPTAMAEASLAAAPDTLDMDEEDMLGDSTAMTRKNTATGFNALDYVMEGRYRAYDERFTNRWDDHLFLEGGLGVQRVVPPGEYSGITPMTVAFGGIGKQFSPLHTARLSLSGALGYRRDKGTRFARAAIYADWLFSLSSYFGGYRPTRLLDVSTVLGAGMQYHIKRDPSTKRSAAEVHGGLQFRFFTGPQGYLAIEPYAGLGQDNMDDSGKSNWRKLDFFYGANVKMIYYIHNNLSPEDRARYSRRGRKADGTMSERWHAPWIIEFGGSANVTVAERMNLMNTLGQGMVISAGKWLSPIVGLRGSYMLSQTRWLQYSVEAVDKQYQAPAYNQNYNYVNSDVRAEALINPLGFLRDFSWNSNFGVYAVGGIGFGWMVKNQRQPLRCFDVSYSGGLHFFARLADGLQVFVEPRYAYYDYRIPYSGVSMSKRFGDNSFAINMGFTVYNTPLPAHKGKGNGDDDRLRRFTVGGCIGANNLYRSQTYGHAGFSYNANGYTEFHITPIHGVRASFEYISLAARTRLGCRDVQYNVFDEELGSTSYTALYNSRYNKGMVSLTYLLDMTRLFAGHSSQQLFRLEAFAGPTMMLHMGSSHDLDEGEVPAKLHQYRLTVSEKKKVKWGVNAGVKLCADIKPGLTLTLTPQLYAVTRNPGLVGYTQRKPFIIKTLSLGVQYSL